MLLLTAHKQIRLQSWLFQYTIFGKDVINNDESIFIITLYNFQKSYIGDINNDIESLGIYR